MAQATPTIKSDSSYFDFAKGMYVLKGNVSVEVSNRLITADEARVKVTTLVVWGERGITLTRGDIYFAGDSVYVDGPKDTAYIKDRITFRCGTTNISADGAEYNWKTKQGVFRNNVIIDDGEKTIKTNLLYYNVAQNTYRTE